MRIQELVKSLQSSSPSMTTAEESDVIIVVDGCDDVV